MRKRKKKSKRKKRKNGVLINKRGLVDVRNTLSWWSLVKCIGDLVFIIAGGGIFYHMPDIKFFSVFFLLWMWSIIKLCMDVPLVFLWCVGKGQYIIKKRG